ncbi:MAG TPA: hypothetical protein VFF06_15220 [Polyangia bacterium]|nr:hypothetical protein [Polyangia bacterium]
MSRGWARLLLLFVLAGAGCDLTVHPFAGTVIQMAIEGVTGESAPGTHLELWARSQYDDIIRIDGEAAAAPSFGVVVRNAITMSDPCMIDGKGDLLTKPEAYPPIATIAGIVQTADEQAATVRNRIAQVTAIGDCDPDGHCGVQGASLLGVIPFDPVTPPHTCAAGESTGCLPWTMAAADRLSACNAYWASTPNAYTPNPAQLTHPAHGIIYGFTSYNTAMPPANADGIRIDSPTNLRGLKELFVTTENDAVDPTMRGPLALDGFPDYGGREVIHFTLSGPKLNGTAALLVNADQDPVQF